MPIRQNEYQPNLLLPEWAQGNPAMDATSMASPLGMAAAPMSRWLPRINLQRLAPKTWSHALFAPEEELVQKSIMKAADAARMDPEFMQNLFLARQKAIAEQSGHAASMGQEVLKKTQEAMDAAQRVQSQQQQYENIRNLFRRRSDQFFGGQ